MWSNNTKKKKNWITLFELINKFKNFIIFYIFFCNFGASRYKYSSIWIILPGLPKSCLLLNGRLEMSLQRFILSQIVFFRSNCKFYYLNKLNLIHNSKVHNLHDFTETKSTMFSAIYVYISKNELFLRIDWVVWQLFFFNRKTSHTFSL